MPSCLALSWCLAFFLAGCASNQQAVTVIDMSTGPDVGDAFRRILNTDNGLLVRTWTVTDDAKRLGDALQHRRDGAVLSPEVEAALQRNGVRLVRVRADVLGALLPELGVAPVQVEAWHGQVTRWRELRGFSIDAPGMVVAVGRDVRSLQPGRLRLLARSWTVQTENGVYLNLELRWAFVRPRAASYPRLLGDQSLPGEVFASMSVEIQLETGYAYILTGEPPGASRDTDDTGPAAPEAGPSAPTPATLGELLFRSATEPPRRHLLVLIPRLPQHLLEPYRLAGDGTSAEDGLQP